MAWGKLERVVRPHMSGVPLKRATKSVLDARMASGSSQHPIPLLRRSEGLWDALASQGVAILGGICAHDALEILGDTVDPYRHPDADTAGATLIKPDNRPGEAGDGFTTYELSMHTDRSSVADPPEILICELRRADQRGGGLPVLSDVRNVVRSLDSATLQHLRETKLALPNGTVLPMFFSSNGRRRVRYREDRHCAPIGDAAAFSRFRASLHANAFIPAMKTGDTYILLNDVYTHGRTRILDPGREVVRILANCKDPQAFNELTVEWDVFDIPE